MSVANLASDETIAKEAYEHVKADWSKLAPDQLLQVNLDLQLASQTLLGAWPEIKLLRERITNELPAFNLQQFDRFEDHVLALMYVQARYAMATQPPNDLQELLEEATRLRDLLEADAQALALRGLFQAEKPGGLKGGNGYRNLAQDLQALATGLEEVLPNVQGKAGTTAEELTAASQIATRLTRVVGVREQSPAVLAALTEERLRAFTFVIKAYDEARAAIGYLRRHEGDAEQIAPNLYSGKAQRNKATEPDVTTPATTPIPGTPLAGGSTVSPPSVLTNGPSTTPAQAETGPFMSGA